MIRVGRQCARATHRYAILPGIVVAPAGDQTIGTQRTTVAGAERDLADADPHGFRESLLIDAAAAVQPSALFDRAQRTARSKCRQDIFRTYARHTARVVAIAEDPASRNPTAAEVIAEGELLSKTELEQRQPLRILAPAVATAIGQPNADIAPTGDEFGISDAGWCRRYRFTGAPAGDAAILAQSAGESCAGSERGENAGRHIGTTIAALAPAQHASIGLQTAGMGLAQTQRAERGLGRSARPLAPAHGAAVTANAAAAGRTERQRRIAGFRRTHPLDPDEADRHAGAIERADLAAADRDLLERFGIGVVRKPRRSSPAADRAVDPAPACVQIVRSNVGESLLRRGGLALPVAPPADRGTVRTQCAAELRADRDCDEIGVGRRIGLAIAVPSPAQHAGIRTQRAGVGVAHRHLQESAGGRRTENGLGRIRPTRQRPVFADRTGLRIAEIETTIAACRRRRRRQAETIVATHQAAVRADAAEGV